MGFASVDDIVSEITGSSAKFGKIYYQKTFANGATSAAGRVLSTFVAPGIPAAGTYSGSAGVATQMTNSTTGALYINANVSTDTRHLLNLSAFTKESTLVPAVVMLVDLLHYYPACVVTGTPTTLNNTATLPRYTSGAGVMCFVEVQTALGAASPALTLNYDGDASTGQTGVLTSPANSAPISTCFQSSGGMFLPLAGANTGVKKINSYTLASGTTGTVAFVLCKPLATFPLLAVNTLTEHDYLFQLPSLPQIVDGACLGFIVQIGGAVTANNITMSGFIDYAWG